LRIFHPTTSAALGRRRRRRRDSGAFTLIELIACVAIMAILAAAAALSLRGHRGDATMPTAMQIVRFADTQARQRGLHSDAFVELRIDFARPNTLVLGTGPASSEFQLPDGFRIARVRVAAASRDTGEVSIRASSHGWTPAYAVQITDGARAQWLAFTDLIGEPHTFDDDQMFEQIFPAAGGSAAR
jgi:prepilin-type N-terminal cleavage/methylation domain-containing protein